MALCTCAASCHCVSTHHSIICLCLPIYIYLFPHSHQLHAFHVMHQTKQNNLVYNLVSFYNHTLSPHYAPFLICKNCPFNSSNSILFSLSHCPSTPSWNVNIQACMSCHDHLRFLLSRLIKGVPFFYLLFSFLTSCSSLFLILRSTAIERAQGQLGVCFWYILFFFFSTLLCYHECRNKLIKIQCCMEGKSGIP